MKQISKFRRILFSISAIALGLLAAICLTEAVLFFFDPLQLRLAGDRICLKTDFTFVIKNDKIPVLDREIKYKHNSIGLRGAEPPKDFDKSLTIITIGGSTTECYYLSEGKTWSDRLQKHLSEHFKKIWVNNAGVDGHTTYGNIVMLKDHVARIKPEVVIFLIGINDVGTLKWCKYDKNILGMVYRENGWITYCANYSKTFALLDTYIRYKKAEKKNLIHFKNAEHTQMNLRKLKLYPVEKSDWKKEIAKHRSNYLIPYSLRVQALIDIAQIYGITPVLVTQPALYGEGTDPTTGVNLERIDVGGNSGRLAWKILELYNDTTRETGKKNNVLVINLASSMPKDSKYFYDFLHFTNQGAEKVAEIINDKLQPLAGTTLSRVQTTGIQITLQKLSASGRFHLDDSAVSETVRADCRGSRSVLPLIMLCSR